MLTLATVAVVLSTLAAGAYLASGRRPVGVQVLCACWQLVAAIVVWQLARFASNTNEWGGDITPQLEMDALALLQVPLFALGALGGYLFRIAGGLRMRIFAGAGVVAALLVALVALGAVQVGGTASYPHAMPGDDGSLPGTDYGPDIRAAAAAAPFPILSFGPKAFGEKLYSVSLTTYTERYPTFGPSAIVDYDEHGSIQISEGLADSTGQDAAFMTGPSITLHGATFSFYQGYAGSPALGTIRGRDIRIDAPAHTRAQWLRTLHALRWACPPARPHCSGW